jgi:hypothetical protein
MRFIIATPNRNFRGVREGLTFIDGIGVTEDEFLAIKLTDPKGPYRYHLKNSGLDGNLADENPGDENLSDTNITGKPEANMKLAGGGFDNKRKGKK